MEWQITAARFSVPPAASNCPTWSSSAAARSSHVTWVVKREKCGQHDSGIGNLVRRKQRGELSIPLELPNAVSVDKEHMVDSHSLFLLLLQRRLVATAQCPVPVSRGAVA